MHIPEPLSKYGKSYGKRLANTNINRARSQYNIQSVATPIKDKALLCAAPTLGALV
jgi:hypothetical protein